jgi:deoxycytidine triphosphate deaminase
MRVVSEARFEELCSAGEISHFDCQFLDGIKIGLRVSSNLLKLPAIVDAASHEQSPLDKLDLDSTPLVAGNFYLATTIERITVSAKFFGILHTRSHWARLGLDCVGSSTYLSPGFGGGTPTPIVLELSPRVSIYNLNSSSFLAGLVLFELDTPVRTGVEDHPFRFPLQRI